MSNEQPKHAGVVEIRHVIVCQRLRELGEIPEGGAVTACDTCGCAVVTHPEKAPGVPRRCIQCSITIIATMLSTYN